ncbi:hypothetical protein RvY_10281 [Ramazzottius varieornatus]|uniref:Caspase family p20 domain-containing protein n=1 Tax=Ramazzottius varieornatus TaxID=947166 RepID=A0A1D1VC89_RAMVA|nr:hypothetical protein RvY_10281 [Ramazzottius varieornatus]
MATEEANSSFYGSPLTPGTPETSFILAEHSRIFSENGSPPPSLRRNVSESSDGILENVMEDFRYPWTFNKGDDSRKSRSNNGTTNGSLASSSSLNIAPDVVDSRDTNGNSAKEGNISSVSKQVADTETSSNPPDRTSSGFLRQPSGTEFTLEPTSGESEPHEEFQKIFEHFPGGLSTDEVAHRERIASSISPLDDGDGGLLTKLKLGSKQTTVQPYPPVQIVVKEEPNLLKRNGASSRHVKEDQRHKNGDGDKPDANPRKFGQPGVSTAPAPKDLYSYRYSMTYPRRGYAVIINNQTFTMRDTPFRKGSDRDAKSLEVVLWQLGFKVDVWTDLTVRDMKDAMTYYAEKDHSDCDAFFFAMFSHGEEGIIYGTDAKISQKSLSAPFTADKCKTLAGKPKIFVYQACRGDKLDEGVDLVEADAGNVACRIPTEQDFLFVYSTVPGYFSWRNTEQGSWFIQHLCQLMSEQATSPDMDFLKLLTRVIYQVGMVCESNVPADMKWHRKKQVPSFESALSKDLYFTPKAQK